MIISMTSVSGKPNKLALWVTAGSGVDVDTILHCQTKLTLSTCITLSRKKITPHLSCVWNKLHRQRIHTMPSIFIRKLLTHVNMTQMSITVTALNLRTPTIPIRNTFHCTRHFIIKTRPTTMCLKLILRTIKSSSTTSTNISAFLPKRIISPSKRCLCALSKNNMFFFR